MFGLSHDGYFKTINNVICNLMEGLVLQTNGLAFLPPAVDVIPFEVARLPGHRVMLNGNSPSAAAFLALQGIYV